MTISIRRWVLIIASVPLLVSCFFGGSVFVTTEGGVLSIRVAGLGEKGVLLGECVEVNTQGDYSCDFGGILSETQILTSAELLATLILLDPLVIQLPNDFTNFTGTFTRNFGSPEPLAITAGLTSVPIDLDRSLTAEPGTQLVVVGFPIGTPLSGFFTFDLGFEMPPGTTEFQAKPILTAYAELADGSKFYPPLLPCVDNMGDAMALTVTLPVPGNNLVLPTLTQDMGCSNVRYDINPDSRIFADSFENTSAP